jgi:secreted trypsin-like serine protease
VETSYTKNWTAQICAGLYSGGKDTCQGDSGGGIYAYDSNVSKYVVVGITSYGEGCARYGKPGYFLIDFINEFEFLIFDFVC